MKDIRLPNKPSALLQLALDDLERCEKDPHYEIYMGEWHSPGDKHCLVCMAGAVIAKTLECDRFNEVTPCLLDHDNSQKLRAIDAFRSNDPISAFNYLKIRRTVPPLIYVTKYMDDPDRFKAQMRENIATLKENRL